MFEKDLILYFNIIAKSVVIMPQTQQTLIPYAHSVAHYTCQTTARYDTKGKEAQ